jgi:hypothetical protein
LKEQPTPTTAVREVELTTRPEEVDTESLSAVAEELPQVCDLPLWQCDVFQSATSQEAEKYAMRGYLRVTV